MKKRFLLLLIVGLLFTTLVTGSAKLRSDTETLRVFAGDTSSNDTFELMSLMHNEFSLAGQIILNASPYADTAWGDLDSAIVKIKSRYKAGNLYQTIDSFRIAVPGTISVWNTNDSLFSLQQLILIIDYFDTVAVLTGDTATVTVNIELRYSWDD